MGELGFTWPSCLRTRGREKGRVDEGDGWDGIPREAIELFFTLVLCLVHKFNKRAVISCRHSSYSAPFPPRSIRLLIVATKPVRAAVVGK